MRITLRSKEVLIDPTEREELVARARALFSRYSRDVVSVGITVTDVNGKRGGVDKRAIITVKPRTLAPFVIEASHEEADAATFAGLRRAQRTLIRRLKQQWAEPRRGHPGSDSV